MARQPGCLLATCPRATRSATRRDRVDAFALLEFLLQTPPDTRVEARLLAGRVPFAAPASSVDLTFIWYALPCIVEAFIMGQWLVDEGTRVMRVGVIAVIVSAAWWPVSTAQQATAPPCEASGPIVRVPDLPEASGVAVSRRTPGRLWAHNDSDDAVLVALDTRGSVTGRVRVSGVTVEDWEAVAVGACPGGWCVYIADIGDNEAERKRITIHRVSEPSSEDSVSVKDTFHATYPDGAHDAETLLVAPSGDLFIVTKPARSRCTDSLENCALAAPTSSSVSASLAPLGRPPKPNGSPTVPCPPTARGCCCGPDRNSHFIGLPTCSRAIGPRQAVLT